MTPPVSRADATRCKLYQRVLGVNLVLVAGYVALALASPASLSYFSGFREPLPPE